MNRFELFTMIYFWLDSFYKNSTDVQINNYLSEMNPFLWTDIGSADPAVYDEYCSFLGDRTITLENSLEIAKEYMATVSYVDVTEAFENINESEWIRGCTEYLEAEHKGSDIES